MYGGVGRNIEHCSVIPLFLLLSLRSISNQSYVYSPIFRGYPRSHTLCNSDIITIHEDIVGGSQTEYDFYFAFCGACAG
jgi:hypothetical protein